eukprot:scaffold45968_cov32-Tisochrysis_lutea.AAC.1
MSIEWEWGAKRTLKESGFRLLYYCLIAFTFLPYAIALTIHPHALDFPSRECVGLCLELEVRGLRIRIRIRKLGNCTEFAGCWECGYV